MPKITPRLVFAVVTLAVALAWSLYLLEPEPDCLLEDPRVECVTP